MKTFIYHKDSHTLREKATREMPLTWEYGDRADYVKDLNRYENHVDSLVNYPCAPGTVWEENRNYKEDEFKVEANYIANINDTGESGWIDYAFPLERDLNEMNCAHEAIIDTGVGYMHCPACGYAEKYDEKGRTKEFTIQEAIQIARDAFSQGLNNYYHPDVLKKMTEDEFLKHYFKQRFNVDLL